MRSPDPLIGLTDEELLTRFREGQQESFGVLLRRYERELYGYLRRYLGDAALADDVFQNTFVQLVTKIDAYEPGRPVRPWLYAIATNQAIDAFRRSGRHQTISLDQTLGETSDGELKSLLELLEARSVDPLEQADGQERRRLVRAAVDRLPDSLRQVVIMAYFQQLKYREIADILGIPVGTVKSRLHAALLKLHETWMEAASPSEA